ncbi:MAG: 4'-phosphopantetheinyl transferase family protein [Acetobacterium sp.]
MNNFKNQIFMADTRPLQDPQFFNDGLAQVTAERREKILRMKSIQAQALSMGAEILLQKALFKSFGIKKELPIKMAAHGKPGLVNISGIHFNLSHSGNYAVCALSRTDIGVDLQKIRLLNLELAKRYFAKDEVKWLLDLPAEKQKKSFFDLWSIKESYMKYTGKGFALPMKNFSVNIKGDAPEEWEWSVFEAQERMPVFLKEYECPDGYVLWCCSGDPAFEEVLEWVSLEKEVSFERN